MSKHDTLDSVIESICTDDSGGLCGQIYVPPLGRDSHLIIDTELASPSDAHLAIIIDCLQLPMAAITAAGDAMLRMHHFLAAECGDLDVDLDSADEIWTHTAPWYVIIEPQIGLQHRYLRFHFKADWETAHGVEVIVRDGREIAFVGNCGTAGSLAQVERGEPADSNFANTA